MWISTFSVLPYCHIFSRSTHPHHNNKIM
jgi:hypothetical protein